jgi:hypothetical protein
MRRRPILAFAFILGAALVSASQSPQPAIQDGQILPLWSGPPPGALGTEDADIPTITVYLPHTMTPDTRQSSFVPEAAT